MPLRLDSAAVGFEAAFATLLAGKREASADVDAAVAEIIAEVRRRGDAALIDYTKRFDRLTLTPQTLRVPQAEIDAAAAACDAETIRALELAATYVAGGTSRNMKDVAEAVQWETGVSQEQRVVLCDAQTSGGLLIAVSGERLIEGQQGEKP